MVLSYFGLKKQGQKAGAQPNDEAGDDVKSPILNEEDEKFLHEITSTDEPPPPLPRRPTVIMDNGKKVRSKDPQVALMDGAEQIPLPQSPPVDSEGKQIADDPKGKEKEDVSPEEEKRRRAYWSYIPSIPTQLPSFSIKGRQKEQAATDLQSAADQAKTGEGADGKTANEKENEDLTSILDQLNVSASNNRVFSFSKESQKLIGDFTIILKDIINGVPTAYDDLEKLLKNREGELQKMYGGMPPFIQTLIKSLPSKMATTLAPEVMAAASGKPQVKVEGKQRDPRSLKEEGSDDPKKKQKRTVPGLKALVSEQGAVAGMLRSILNFLKLRFPAFVTGTNVLMSLAVFGMCSL